LGWAALCEVDHGFGEPQVVGDRRVRPRRSSRFRAEVVSPQNTSTVAACSSSSWRGERVRRRCLRRGCPRGGPRHASSAIAKNTRARHRLHQQHPPRPAHCWHVDLGAARLRGSQGELRGSPWVGPVGHAGQTLQGAAYSPRPRSQARSGPRRLATARSRPTTAVARR
jgi:hypothetical protein